jgi:exonuclease III
MVLYKFFTDEEFEKIKRYPRVKVDEGYDVSTMSVDAKKVFDFYKKLLETDMSNKNVRIIQNVIDEMLKLERIDYMRDKRVNEQGYEYCVIPAGTKFYKATTWFYTTLPKFDENSRQVWMGDSITVAKYLGLYRAGVIVYKATKDVKVFLLNVHNFSKLIEDPETPPDVQYLCKYLYGVDITPYEKIDYMKQQSNRKFIWVKQTIECEEGAEIMYQSLPRDFNDESKKMLVHHVTGKYGADGTIMPHVATPFLGCMDLEITLGEGSFEMDKTDPIYWENWGLDIKLNHEFTVNKSYANINFKIYDWITAEEDLHDYEGYDNKKFKMMTYNVHNMESVNAYHNDEDMYKIVRKTILDADPDILVMQEMKFKFIERIKRDCGFKQTIYTINGTYPSKNNNYNAYLAVYLKRPCKFEVVRHNSEYARNFIVLEYGGLRIVGAHLPIGVSYIRRGKLVYDDEFASLYESNTKLRMAAIDHIFKYKPDIILGDMNFAPVDKELERFKDYQYDNDNTTSIHKIKVDYIFYPKTWEGVKTRLIMNPESDHRPLIAYMPVDKFKREGGEEPVVVEIAYILIILCTVMVVLLVLLVYSIVQCVSFTNS